MITFARRFLPAPLSRRFAPLLAVFTFVAAVSLAAASPPPNYAARPEVREFVDELVSEHAFDRRVLQRLFAQVRHQPPVIGAMQRPLLEPPKWYDYARPFLNSARVSGGVIWWKAHAEDLARAEERYGVPSEVIVAILGVETNYGRNIGGYRALDALATLAFDYPRRAEFFRGELKQFLLLARELGISPLVPKGSFAGALGVPQFMPGSYRRFAVDFDESGRADLWASPADIVGSVAHFLAEHGWQPGGPVLFRAAIVDEARDAVIGRLDGGISERQSLALWAAAGVTPADEPTGPVRESVGLLLLEENEAGGPSTSYWIACHNFYVLTRYNRSRLYAAAVWELAKAIKAAQGNAQSLIRSNR
jgi:membrane-bound lytic murein transglycosylase B